MKSAHDVSMAKSEMLGRPNSIRIDKQTKDELIQDAQNAQLSKNGKPILHTQIL